MGICSGLALRTKLLFHFAFIIIKLLAKVQVNVVRNISSDIQIPASGLKTVAWSNFFKDRLQGVWISDATLSGVMFDIAFKINKNS